MTLRSLLRAAACLFVALSAAACSSESTAPAGSDPPSRPSPSPSRLSCNISRDFLVDSGAGLGAIPALVDPELVPPSSEEASYLRTPDEAGTANIRDHDRVIALRLDGEWIAVPHNILWWHEVAHFTRGQRDLVVTYCPLTGSSLAFRFDRLPVSQFEVSGLLFNSNLVLRDPETGSLWPQMTRAAACGPQRGRALPAVPVIEARWEAWRAAHPGTRVVSSATGFDRNYSEYPYGRYEQPESAPFFEVAERDRRRDFKERVLGIPSGQGGVAYPFGELEGRAARAVRDTVGGEALAVFWNASARSAVAFRPRAGGRQLTFRAEDGRLVDEQTGSRWRFDGRAIAGPLEGERLRPVADAYVAFWFAWAVFQPETTIWTADSGG